MKCLKFPTPTQLFIQLRVESTSLQDVERKFHESTISKHELHYDQNVLLTDSGDPFD